MKENTYNVYKKIVNDVMWENPIRGSMNKESKLIVSVFKERLEQILAVKKELHWFNEIFWVSEKSYYPDKLHNYSSCTDLYSIYWTLNYICDRWRCFMRTAWLVEVLDNYENGLFDHLDGLLEDSEE